MFNKLAIIIVGEPNAGKTTTLKEFVNTYNNEKVDVFRQGWRHNIELFKSYYNAIKIVAYFIPSSRTEKHEPLKDIFNNLNCMPDFLFMAEQLDGEEYLNTIQTLRKCKYHIKEFVISESNSDTIWHRYEEKNKSNILLYRTEQIADYVRQFIKSRI